MKILVLASGGDAPGMNKFIVTLYKKFKEDLYGCHLGFKGLVEGDIRPMEEFEPLRFENCAGCCIKTSRYPEFKEEKFFKKGLKNCKDFDAVVIMGGNGSQKGALQLAENGVNTIFVPATIDNDVEGSQYSIGFFSAVHEVCHTIYGTMPSMEAMNRTCIFEVMGRYCPAIAELSAAIVGADMLITNEKELSQTKILALVKQAQKEDHSSIIIMREKITSLSDLVDSLNEKFKQEVVKGCVVGHVQRGGAPTKHEKEYAKLFAKETIKAIKKGEFPKSILI